jgi:hypothetical protein
MGKIVPEAVVELGDDQACVMIRSDFSYQLTYERCDGGAHLKSLARWHLCFMSSPSTPCLSKG